MKTSKLINVAWVIFALVLTTTTVLAQGRGNGNRYNQKETGDCLNYISGLTETQQKQIQEMEDGHQQAMAELRTTRRSTINAVEKSEIRTEMLKNVEAYREEVKNVFTAEQQEQYGQLHADGSFGRNQNLGRGQGNGPGGKGNNRSKTGRGIGCRGAAGL